MGAAEEDLTESSALEECCCGPMFPRESRGLSKADCTTLHFFDESGVKITSRNHVYGNSYIGEPAIEVQRYVSNANYTLNLHSIQGVDYYNINYMEHF